MGKLAARRMPITKAMEIQSRGMRDDVGNNQNYKTEI
jgi:hypothetical protein